MTSSKGDVYQLATDESGRTATVTVTKTATGARIQLALHPSTDVQQVYDAFDTAPADHFLGGGEHGERADLRGKILSVEVGYQCSYAPMPFFASTAGWGVRIASQSPAGLAFPGSPGGEGCQVGDHPPCSFPPLADRAEVCLQSARARRAHLRREPRPDARRLQAAGGRPRCRRRRSSS